MAASDSYSVVEELANTRPIVLQGEGELKLKFGQDDPPTGPGQVQFCFYYAPWEYDKVEIRLALKSLDDGGKEILKWKPKDGLRTICPLYDLTGTVDVGKKAQPISMDTVTVDYNLSPETHMLDYYDLVQWS
jgi:hypothetical protein